MTLYAQLFLSCFFNGDRGLALPSHDEIFQAFPSNRELTLRNLPMTFLSVTKEYIGSSGLEVKREKHPPLANIPSHMGWDGMRWEEREMYQTKGGKDHGALTKRRWLKKGFALLEEAGAEALTIESLTNRLDVISGE